ncbi:MAG: class I SAM-dependent methyltransferase [Eubacteriales bacterium]
MRNEKKVWDRFAPMYDRFMKKDMPLYSVIIERIKVCIKKDKNVLEIATGTGTIALGIAECTDAIEAVDLSAEMIAKAKKKAAQQSIDHIHFSVQDAYDLKYEDQSFDYVIITNTLHIMPNPQKALEEIKRVLKKGGYMIAPTFVHAGSKKAALMSKLMSWTGFRAYHKWTQISFCRFIDDYGFDIVQAEILESSFPLVYLVAKVKSS